MAKLTWEWADGKNEIIVRKSRGKITLLELQEYLSEAQQYNAFGGMLAVIQWRVHDAEMMYDGYTGEDDDPGDCIAIQMVGDGDACPVCGENSIFPQYCPKCGEPLKEKK